MIETPKSQAEGDKKADLQEEIARTKLKLQKLKLARLQDQVAAESKKNEGTTESTSSSSETNEPKEKVKRLSTKEIKEKLPFLEAAPNEVVDVVGDIACAVGSWFCESESAFNVLLGKGIINTLTKPDDTEEESPPTSSETSQASSSDNQNNTNNDSNSHNHNEQVQNSKTKAESNNSDESQNIDIQNSNFELTLEQRKIVRRNINSKKGRYYRESFDAGMLDVRMEHLMYSLIEKFGEKAIQYTSTIRSTSVNNAVGGAKKSDHLDGNAFDVSESALIREDKRLGLPSGTMKKRVRAYLNNASKKYGKMYVLFHKSHFHVSMRYLENRHDRLPEIKTSKDLLTLTKTYKRKKSIPKLKESNESSKEKKILALYNSTVKKYEKDPRVAKGKTVYIVNPHERPQTMYGIKNNKVVEKTMVSTGYLGVGNKSGSEKTPIGAMITSDKHGDGVPKGGILVAKKYNGRVGKIKTKGTKYKSPVTTRIVCLEGLDPKGTGNSNTFKRCIYLHGTLAENKIGEPASKGCIRMKNDEMIDFYNTVPRNSLVYVPKESQMA